MDTDSSDSNTAGMNAIFARIDFDYFLLYRMRR